jgi:hypothetical protein
MDGISIFLFIVSLALLITSITVILYDMNTGDVLFDQEQTSSGIPLLASTMIGAQCPVGCTCFPNPNATTSRDAPTQICAMLDNGVMFSCPSRCCQPTCINQDVQGIARRGSQ